MEDKKVIKIKATVKREIESREGIDSTGSDYWFHRDVMEEDNELQDHASEHDNFKPLNDDARRREGR